uniref:Uncharacterized protein n=1 Tax=Knipowitschia caucasica TaxID=637954 RepID=A0AAV2KHR7_KNICA
MHGGRQQLEDRLPSPLTAQRHMARPSEGWALSPAKCVKKHSLFPLVSATPVDDLLTVKKATHRQCNCLALAAHPLSAHFSAPI